MNILEGIRPNNPKSTSTQTKFIIKSKPSTKENRAHQTEFEPQNATTQDVHQLITYILNKSKKFSDLMESQSISDVSQFSDRHLFSNPSMRTILKSTMDRMLSERRIGKNLKGMNKGILQQIEGIIWVGLEREVALYQLSKMYEREKESLQKQIANRKQQIQCKIQELAANTIEKEVLDLSSVEK